VRAKEKASAIPAAKVALYEKLIATDPSIERKGATIPYTSSNGKMSTYLSPTGELRMRLPDAERAAFKPYLAMSHAYAAQLGPKTGAKRAASRASARGPGARR
jgi:hypothetical protein